MPSLTNTLLTTGLLTTLAMAQSPAPTAPQTYLPIIIPTGTSFAASVITAAPDGNVYQFAVQCLDDICSNDPPATATFSLESATGTYAFAWTAKDNPANATSYGCAISTDVSASVPCTVAVAGSTITAQQYSAYPMSLLAARWDQGGIAQPVGITAGAGKLPASSLLCGASLTTCSLNEVVEPSGDGNAPTSGAGSASSASGSGGRGPASNSASATGSTTTAKQTSAASGAASGGSASASASATGGAASVAGGVGAVMAAVAFVGAVAL